MSRAIAQKPERALRGLLRFSIAALTIFAFAGDVAAQVVGTVNGTVTRRSNREPVAGAQVSVVGTNLGALTGNQGRFSISGVPAGSQEIRVDFIGFGQVTRTVVVPAGGEVTVNIELRAEAITLEGVVVTGTAGQARRREIGNSIAQISAAEIENSIIADVGDVLQGRAAGVTVVDNSGQVGTASAIRLRGNNSLSQGNYPLVYIDGIRVRNTDLGNFADEVNQNTSPLNDINANDIERVEVIKGAAATTLYGTEAAGGVIQIFTKRGAAGAPAWSFNMDQGINYMGHVGPDEAWNSTGWNLNDCSAFPGCPSNGSWFRRGYVQRYNMSVRGGSESVNYFLSGGWGDEAGVVDPQGEERYQVRGNFGFRPDENLTIRFNTSYTHRAVQWFPDGNNAEGLVLNVARGTAGYTPNADHSVIFQMKLNTLTDHFTTGMNLLWDQGNGINHRLNVGLDWAESDYTEEKPWGFWRDFQGAREVDQVFSHKLTLDYAGSWDRNFGSFASQFSWGGQLFDDFINRINGFSEAFAGPGDKDLSSGAITEAFENRLSITNGGFFFQERLGWNDKLFVTVGARVDGHSTFGDDFGLQTYPKASLSYVISDEDWFPSFFESLKLRTAYGESGKAPGVFDATRTFEPIAGDEGQPGLAKANLGNPELGPERSQELEMGFEGAVWNGRFIFDYTYYNQKTIDALVNVVQPPSQGFLGSQLENVGEISNWGHEITGNLTVLDYPNLTLDVGGNYAWNKSMVDELGGDLTRIDLAWRNAIVEGMEFPVFCNEFVQNPDEFADPVIEDDCVGPLYPRHQYGLRTSIAIGQRLALDVLGEGQTGHWLSSGTAHQNTRRQQNPLCEDVWAADDANQPLDRFTALERGRCLDSAYGLWTQRADFFKLRSASLSYRLPESMLPGGIRAATLRLQGRNLFTMTDFVGLDPEALEDGSGDVLYRQEYYNLPPARSLVLSVRVDF